MEVNRFQLSIIVTTSFILDVGKGSGLGILIFLFSFLNFFLTLNSIQKLIMAETALNDNYKIIFTITGSSFLLSSKIELFARVVKDFQL